MLTGGAGDAMAQGLAPQSRPPAAPSPVISVFQIKCAACHSTQSKKAKKFNYILDLKQMAASKYVVAGNPDKSKLWDVIQSGDMPPEDAKTGPLSADQKAIIRTWIAAGAPVNGPTGGASPLAGSGAPTGSATSEHLVPSSVATSAGEEGGRQKLGFGRRLLRLIGKFHPLIAHFPIALMVGAAVAELAWLHTKKPWLPGAIRFCFMFGAAGAILAASLGWADACFHTHTDELTIHRWIGTAAALWAIPTFFLSERGFRHRTAAPPGTDEPTPWFTVLLFIGVTLIGVAAHFGGNLVYGADYLSW